MERAKEEQSSLAAMSYHLIGRLRLAEMRTISIGEDHHSGRLQGSLSPELD